MNLTRRTFIKAGVTLGTAFAFGKSIKTMAGTTKDIPEYLNGAPHSDTLDTSPDVKLVYSVCLQCRSDCAIRGKVKDGILLKIDGNPYSEMTYDPLPYDTDPKEAAKHRGRLCPKGQAGIQTAYDPYRIKQPLKRVGARGSGKWQSISWEQAIEEIVEGGNLFGEGQVDGLRATYDPNTPIDSNAPELGPKSNQFIFLTGRIEEGRKDFLKRFLFNSFGSINYYEHTSICEISHHIATAYTVPQKAHLKPDIVNAHYIINFGGSYLEANFPFNGLAYRVGKFKERGGKLVVVDPRLSQTAAKADRWLPVKPGGDGALAMGMIRWIIENKRYDKRYLENTTKEAATNDNEPTWSNATYLVRLDTNKFLRADEAGLDGTNEDFVVLQKGQPTVYNKVEHGDLEGSVIVNGIACKTSFTLLKEEAYQYSLKEYAENSGIEEKVIAEIAEEFTSYGKTAVADFYRGPIKHTHGFYTGRAIVMLNLLIGNFDWKGGYTVGGGGYDFLGKGKNARYKLSDLHPNKVKEKGVKISREMFRYEDTTEFKKNGYPAKRPWFPFTENMYQEVIAGIADEYPYPAKVLWLHMGNPAYTAPSIKDIVIKTLTDTKKVPLFISTDIVIGETSMYADYILPDVSYLEQWGTPGTPPTIVSKHGKVRQPIIKVYPNTMSMENILIMIAKKMGLSGFGDNGFGPGMPLNKEEDYYLKLVANMAYDANVPGNTEEEKIKYVLDRGGVFENVKESYDGAYMGHKFGKMVYLYAEEIGSARHSITGKYYNGVPMYEQTKDFKGNVIKDEGYPFMLMTYKLPFHTSSRTIADPWLVELMPENFIEINAQDAKKLGLKNGDKVRLVSATNSKGVEGKVRILQGLRPGVVSVSFHFGHWAYGATNSIIDGKETGFDPTRATGINPNPVMRLDTSVGNTCLTDPIGGSANFNSNPVNIIKL